MAAQKAQRANNTRVFCAYSSACQLTTVLFTGKQLVSRIVGKLAVACAVLLLCMATGHSQSNTSTHPDIVNPPSPHGPMNEFHLARLVFEPNGWHSWGPGRPWWRIDWPEAEFHFLHGLQRYTKVDSFTDSAHVQLDDPELFDYPWLFAQQVGRWYLTESNVQRLGEYLRRGGFILADDIHGPQDWKTFSDVMQRALPEYHIEDIRSDDQSMAVLYDLDRRTQIPGRRHITGHDAQGNAEVHMPYGPPKWRGIKDSHGRWMVAINYNMDMGDSWEHSDDPYYPLAMTSLGYRLGINYVLYALTH